MRHFKSGKSNESEATSIGRSLPARYCDHCHLATPKANPRCIHCRRLLPAIHLPAARIETQVA
jgi:hypothetical protein